MTPTEAPGAIRRAVDDANPFGDIGHADNADALSLREFGLQKARDIADAVDQAIAENDTSTIADIAKVVGPVVSGFIPAPILAALGTLPGIVSRLAS